MKKSGTTKIGKKTFTDKIVILFYKYLDKLMVMVGLSSNEKKKSRDNE